MSEVETPEPDDDDDEGEDDEVDEGQEQAAQATEAKAKDSQGKESSKEGEATSASEQDFPILSQDQTSSLGLFASLGPTEAPKSEQRTYEDMIDDPNLTEQSLQETLNSYAEAIRKEYETTTAASPENVEEYTRDFFKKNVHSAAAQIVWLANNADSESVRLKAATTVVHEALAEARAEGDPIKVLLNELTAPKPTK